jgi:DNA-binding GntR family transcriptional regulator
MDDAGESATVLRLGRTSQPPRAEQVREALRARIVDGTLAPGTWLSEPTIATELQVSRTPVREALGRLEEEGLVRRTPGLGAFVAELTEREAAEIIGIRSVLEGYAAQLAAARIADEELTRVSAAHSAAEAAMANDDVDALLLANMEFHDAVNAASHSPRTVVMINGLRDWVVRYRTRVLVDVDRRRRSFECHAQILEALSQRDEAAAERAMREHIHDAWSAVLSTMLLPTRDSAGRIGD